MTNQTHTWKALTPSRASKMRIARTIQFIALAILPLLPFSVKSQTVAPIGGLGNIQFFDNSGALLTNGVLYSFQAGTSTQQATFTDSSGLIQNPNPIPFGSGARVQIWLSIGSAYKFVLCVQNDGPFCATGDILFTVDNVPGGSASSGGSSSSPFISGTANPATSGILRLASGDTTCWRNAAGSTNICWSKDANDQLSWGGGGFKLPEVGAPSCVPGFDQIWADNTAHRWKMCLNGGGPWQFVAASNDINTSDAVVQLHFGATPTPLSGTAPTTNQFLQWNGSAIVGTSTTAFAAGTASMPTAAIATTACSTIVTQAVTGVTTADVIAWAFTTEAPGLLTLQVWVTAGNVNFAYCNPSAGSITPGPETLNWKILR